MSSSQTEVATRKETPKRPFDVERVRADFPALHQNIKGKPLVYLDSAASAQKPHQVLGVGRDHLALRPEYSGEAVPAVNAEGNAVVLEHFRGRRKLVQSPYIHLAQQTRIVRPLIERQRAGTALQFFDAAADDAVVHHAEVQHVGFESNIARREEPLQIAALRSAHFQRHLSCLKLCEALRHGRRQAGGGLRQPQQNGNAGGGRRKPET